MKMFNQNNVMHNDLVLLIKKPRPESWTGRLLFDLRIGFAAAFFGSRSNKASTTDQRKATQGDQYAHAGFGDDVR